MRRNRTSLRLGRGVVAAALALSGAACRSAPEPALDPYSVQKVVVNAKGEAPPPGPDAATKAAAAASAYQAAHAAWLAGDALGALALANRALIDGVPPELDAPLRDLRAKARASLVATKICRVRVLPDRDVVADATPVAVRLEFANLSTTTLRVPRSQKDSSDATVVLTLTRQDFDVYGNARSFDYTLSAPVRDDLVLAPGAVQESRLAIPADMAKLQHEGFSVLTLAGTFRPVALRAGESEFFDAIPIEGASVRIFMKGFEPLADDPLGSLRKAVAKRSPPHILTSAELLEPSDRAEARRVLEAARADDPPLAPVVDAALARIGTER